MLFQQISVQTFNFSKDFALTVFDKKNTIQLSSDGFGKYSFYKEYNQIPTETIQFEIYDDYGTTIKKVDYISDVYRQNIFIKLVYQECGDYYIEWLDKI
jgi:hypothetical protein